jgi:hypothetical protein
MANGNESWKTVVVTAVVLPIVVALLSTYFIPRIIDYSNKAEALRIARLKKSVDVEERNREFTSKFHVLKTSLQMFHKQNVLAKLSGKQLREAQDRFRQQYTDRYLAFDETAWWQFESLGPEATAFDLLSSEENAEIVKLAGAYGNNAAKSVGAIDPLWRHLCSTKYTVNKKGQKYVAELDSTMEGSIRTLDDERQALVTRISTVFAQTRYQSRDVSRSKILSPF